MMRFKSKLSAKAYLKDNKYRLSERFSVKGDRAYLYKKRSSPKNLYLYGCTDYLDNNSMDRGVVWFIKTF